MRRNNASNIYETPSKTLQSKRASSCPTTIACQKAVDVKHSSQLHLGAENHCAVGVQWRVRTSSTLTRHEGRAEAFEQHFSRWVGAVASSRNGTAR